MTTKQQPKEYEALGVVAIALAVFPLIPAFNKVAAIAWLIAVVLGGEARCKGNTASKVLGIIAEVAVAVEVVVCYICIFGLIK